MYYLLNKDEVIAEFDVDALLDAVACLTPKTRKVLQDLQGFEFKRHPKYNLPEWRLNALEREMRESVRAILDKDVMYTKQVVGCAEQVVGCAEQVVVKSSVF